MRQAPRHVVIVAHNYPPVGGSGVYRSAKMSKYLSRLGWRVSVISANRPFAVNLDPALEAEVAGAIFSRHAVGGNIRDVSKQVREWVQGAGRPISPLRAALGWRMERLLVRLSRYVLFPDGAAAWSALAYRELCRLHRETPVDVVVTSSDPYSAHLVGLRASRRLGLPWAADFRDIWVDDYAWRPPTRLHRFLHRRAERAVVRTADRVIHTTEAATALYRRRYPDLPAGKFATVWNGHDFGAGGGAQEADGGYFLYAGAMDRSRVVPGLFEALRLAGNGTGGVPLKLAGNQCPEVRVLVAEKGLEKSVEFLGYVPQDRMGKLLRESRGLLCVVNNAVNDRIFVPAKLFEYAASGRPTLLLGPADSEAARLLRELRSGEVVERDDVEGMARWFRRQASQREPSRWSERIALYSREHQAGVLSELLQEIMHG